MEIYPERSTEELTMKSMGRRDKVDKKQTF